MLLCYINVLGAHRNGRLGSVLACSLLWGLCFESSQLGRKRRYPQILPVYPSSLVRVNSDNKLRK